MAVRSARVKSDSTGAAIPPKAPVKATSKAPVKAPVKAAVKATSKAAVKAAVKAPVKAAVKATRRRAKPKAQSGPTPIRVHYNVGHGNRITVRGDTDPFRWDCGIDTQNAAADVWEFELEQVPAGQTFQFKPLINDTTYSSGDNYVGTGGQTLDIYPAFQ